ncbi:MAG: hypothetical protein JSU64_07520 [candidate division WOR-3 bacterium]|nr:MAG: hypothetical protein JSU64_07520 [candidate division WOR-3 bacterium]
METVNLFAAWIGMLIGAVVGAFSGLFFHRQEWFGGYDSWQRRMLRLGHISFFGIAFINFAFVFTIVYLGISKPLFLPSVLLIVGAITMPLICFLSAYKMIFRHLFFIPVVSIIVAMFVFLIGGVLS